jgi:hypothetical protein
VLRLVPGCQTFVLDADDCEFIAPGGHGIVAGETAAPGNGERLQEARRRSSFQRSIPIFEAILIQEKHAGFFGLAAQRGSERKASSPVSTRKGADREARARKTRRCLAQSGWSGLIIVRHMWLAGVSS